MVADREASTFALHKLRKLTGWYTHGLPNGRKLRQAINQLPDVPTFMATVEEFLGELLVEEEA
jgi:tRNA-dihydrouridine synthase